MEVRVALILSAALLACGAGCSSSNRADARRGKAAATAVTPAAPPASADAPAADPPPDETDDPNAEPDVESVPWLTGPSIVGPGVAYKDTQRTSDRGVAVLYAGYRADLAGAEAWATALYRASLRDRGIRHIFAVQGPATSNYAGREIGNSSVAAALERMVGAGAPRVLVVAHSSGAFVAHELLAQLTNPTAAKVVYFDLDGATWGLTNAGAARLHRVFFVGARDATTKTPGFNSGAMKVFAGRYAAAGFFEVDASSSGCNQGATECVHMALVNARPHDASKADVETDYHGFDDEHPVETSWLDAKGDEAGVVAEL